MTSTKYIGMDVHKESISIAVLNFAGKAVMECVIETKAGTLLQFIHGLGGDVEGTWLPVSCLSWNWRGRSSVKITERTHEKRAKALHRRREGCHPEAAFVG
jgi:hypothetical protein